VLNVLTLLIIFKDELKSLQIYFITRKITNNLNNLSIIIVFNIY